MGVVGCCQGLGKTKTWTLPAWRGILPRWVGWAEVWSRTPGTSSQQPGVSLSLASPSMKEPRLHWPVLWADGLQHQAGVDRASWPTVRAPERCPLLSPQGQACSPAAALLSSCRLVTPIFTCLLIHGPTQPRPFQCG